MGRNRNINNSYGIILIKFNNDIEKYNFITNINEITKNKNSKIYVYDNIHKNDCNKCIEYLIIQRKYSMGYSIFIRGSYNENNKYNVENIFKRMTNNEINDIINIKDFKKLWDNFWVIYGITSETYKNEYRLSEKKYETIINNGMLNMILNNIKNIWIYPEWEFPKGKKKIREHNLNCAKREFEEETGFTSKDYTILLNIQPIYEKFVGTNGEKYIYVYYLALSNTNKIPIINIENSEQIKEISNIGYYNCTEIVKKIRFYQKTKINNIINLDNFIMNIIKYTNKEEK